MDNKYMVVCYNAGKKMVEVNCVGQGDADRVFYRHVASGRFDKVVKQIIEEEVWLDNYTKIVKKKK